MSYQCIKAVGRPRVSEDYHHRHAFVRYEQIEDVGSKTHKQITDDYRDVYLLIENTYKEKTIRVSIFDLDLALYVNETLDEYLERIDVDALELDRPSTLKIETKRAQFFDEADTTFSIEPSRSGSHPTQRWPDSAHPDLLLTHSGWDYENYKDLHYNTIFFINGYAHRSSYSKNGLYVIDANTSSNIASNSELGMLDLSSIGSIEQINLSSDMLYRPHPENRYYDRAYLDLPTSLSSKTVLLSLGGYLHLLDDIYEVISDGSIAIDFTRYPFVRRYFESIEQIDLSKIEYTPYDRNDHQRYLDELIKSEDTIKSFLDLSQTFAIVIDQPNVFIERHKLEYSSMHGVFYAYEKPKGLIQTQRGRMRNYRCEYEDGTYVVNIQEHLLPNYHFDYTELGELQTVAPWKRPHKPYIADTATRIELGIDRVI